MLQVIVLLTAVRSHAIDSVVMIVISQSLLVKRLKRLVADSMSVS